MLCPQYRANVTEQVENVSRLNLGGLRTNQNESGLSYNKSMISLSQEYKFNWKSVIGYWCQDFGTPDLREKAQSSLIGCRLH